MIARWMIWQDFPLKMKLYYGSAFEVHIINVEQDSVFDNGSS